MNYSTIFNTYQELYNSDVKGMESLKAELENAKKATAKEQQDVNNVKNNYKNDTK